MPAPPITKAEADKIVAAPKTIRQSLVWKVGGNESFARGELPVEGAGVSLTLFVSVNLRAPTIFSFALSVSKAFRIRGLDVNGAHGNNHSDDHTKFYGTHLHVWTDKCHDRLAVAPHETISDELEEAFVQFCDMCNITFTGHIDAVPAFRAGFWD